jgi:hypothetical protein
MNKEELEAKKELVRNRYENVVKIDESIELWELDDFRERWWNEEDKLWYDNDSANDDVE